jgi:serine/threonine protein kinase
MDPTHASESPDPFISAVLSRGLRVLERLGETPAGRVYRAQYFSAEPSVVIVALNPSSEPRQRFSTPRPPPEVLQQLQHASRIRHPNVAGVREIGETSEGVVYAVLDAVPGEPLHDVVTTRRTLPLQEAVDLTLQAAAGLRAAHAAGVVHGNLSPETVLVSDGPDGQPLVKLVGFASVTAGLATPAGLASMLEPGAFASPEQAAGGAPDRRGDVYSLAAILLYMLTGEPPTKGSIPRSVPKRIRSVLSDALAASLTERFQTVHEFEEALQEAMTQLPPASSGTRRRAAAVGAGLVALGLLAGAGWVLIPAMRDHFGAPTTGRHQSRGVPADSALETANAPGRRFRGSDTGAAPGEDASPVRSQPPAGPAAPRRNAPDERKAAAPPDVALSPFRRSHPWAALPDGRVYFKSSCSLALGAPELIYFDSEEKAQATGREKSTVPGCF